MSARSLKKTAIFTVLGAAAAAGAHAQSSVTLYGVVDTGVEYAKAGRSSQRVISGGALGSRLGFRGVEDLGGGLSAVFRLEEGINVDNGSLAQGGLAFGREATVGLSSPAWGTFQLGRMGTPYYSVQSAVDAFQWMGGGGLLALSRSGTATWQLLPSAVSARYDNALGYVSPRFGGLEIRAIYALDENSTTMGKGLGASARYTAGGLDLVAGYNRVKAADAGTGKVEAMVLGGSYKFSAAAVYAGYTRETNNCSTCTGALTRVAGLSTGGEGQFNIINLGARVPFGAFTAIAQVTRVQDRSSYAVDPGDRDATWVGIGGEYALSKRSMVYASVASIGNQNGSQYALGTGSSQQPSGSVGSGNPRAKTFAIGIRHLF